MSKENIDPIELKLSDQFDQGLNDSVNPDEDQVLKSYARIRQGLKEHSVPAFNQQVVLQQMVAESKRTTAKFSHFNLNHLNSTGYTWAASFCSIALLVGILFFFYSDNPVQQIKLNSLSQNNDSINWIWKQRLQRGKYVTVPVNSEIELLLADGSIISCSPETQLAIDFDRQRKIFLNQGEIVIHAAHIPDSTMIVITPLTEIAVVGTVFRVKASE